MSPLTPLPTPTVTIPVLEEKLQVGTAVEQSGALRVRIQAREVDSQVDLEHVTHGFEVVRVPRGTPVSATREPWTEGDVIVVPVYEEVAVVERRLILKEEIRLSRSQTRSTTPVTVPLRHEQAIVERMQADGSWKATDAEPGPPARAGDPGA